MHCLRSYLGIKNVIRVINHAQQVKNIGKESILAYVHDRVILGNVR